MSPLVLKVGAGGILAYMTVCYGLISAGLAGLLN